VHTYQEKVKQVFDKQAKPDNFNLGYLVLKWDARYEDKGKHGKFDELWKGAYSICSFSRRNAYFLKDYEGQRIGTRPVNDRFLKHYLTWFTYDLNFIIVNWDFTFFKSMVWTVWNRIWSSQRRPWDPWKYC
jgi:hypothetical protein